MPGAGHTKMPIFVLTDHGGAQSERSEAAEPQGHMGGGSDELKVQRGHAGEKAAGSRHSGEVAQPRTARATI